MSTATVGSSFCGHILGPRHLRSSEAVKKENPIFDEIPLNQMPDLTMADITKRLFDNEFLSNLKFTFKRENIKSHTFELRKRSTAFCHEFPTTINTLYPAFYEVIKYIYTDDCEILPQERIPMLKLALKYKLPSLEMKLLNGLTDCCAVDVYEYSVLAKYNLISNMMREWIQNQLYANINCSKLETLHPEVIEQILNLDFIKNCNEEDLFGLLARWINRQCDIHQIPLASRRVKFDKFIRLIRFPTMTMEQFAKCLEHDIEILSKRDILQICRQITLGDQCADCTIWNASPRLVNATPYKTIAVATNWKTKFSVVSDIILRGLRFGLCHLRSNFNIRITGKNLDTNGSESLNFKFDKSMCPDTEIVVNLGERIRLKPKYEYTIEIETNNGLVDAPNLRDGTRIKLEDEYLNLTQSQIIMQLESANLLEIDYKLV